MCGIAGIFAYHYAANPVERDELLRIREHMKARGPDGAGLWLSADERAGLASRRLAIIDLTDRAAQPFASEDGRYVLVFNGEIYNYKALRAELEAGGARFRSDSDTEVILQLFIREGVAMLPKLRGITPTTAGPCASLHR
jgi:asparagine synthase (glutamine-hydrolysing)